MDTSAEASHQVNGKESAVRIGIVGNHLYGQIFTRSIETTGRAQAVAMCPEFSENLEPFATEHHLKPYPDLNSMLRAEKLDAVMVASVTANHESDAIACLSAGAHVLVDRPMAMTVQGCDNMIAAAWAAGRTCMVGYVLQFWPEYVAIREMIQRGDLGKPLFVTASRVSGVLNPSWQARLLNPNYGLGGLEAHAHDIDLLISLFGEPQEITAHGTFTKNGSCAQVHSLLRFKDGCRAGVEADYRVPLNFPLSMYFRVVGEAAAAVFTFRGALAARDTARRRVTLFKDGSDPVDMPVPITDAYANMVNYFIDCIAKGEEPQAGSPRQARQSVQTLLAIRHSAQAEQMTHPLDSS
jgi:predicted dehydrogenase